MKNFVKNCLEASHWFFGSAIFIVLSILILLAWVKIFHLQTNDWLFSMVNIFLFIFGSYIFVSILNKIDQKFYSQELKYGRYVYVSFPIYDKYFFYVLFFHLFYLIIFFTLPLIGFWFIMFIPIGISIYRAIIKPKIIFPAY